MESSKEKIEAQLCAYVDGELDDAQRADIEQHLAANPQHQALIAELRAASGLLRDLPRVAAPIELNESLCGQLERSSLLNPVDDHSDPLRSGNRWPQFTAVAAVLILAVGLGLVIYFVLPPSGGRSGNQLAMENRSKEAGLGATTRDLDGDNRLDEKAKSATNPAADSSDFDKLSKMSESELQSRAAGKPSEAPRPDQARAKDTYAYGDQTGRSLNRDLDVARQPEARRRGMVTAAEVENVRKWMNESLGTDTNFFNSTGNTSLYLVVSTQNTSAVNGQLAAYFKGNGIQYMADDSRPTADAVAGAGEKWSAGEKLNGAGFGGGGFGGAGGAGGARASSLGGGRMAVRAATPELKASEPARTPAPAAKPDLATADAERGLKNAPSVALSDAIKAEAASTSPPAPQTPANELARGDAASKKLETLNQQGRMRATVEEKDKSASDGTFALRDNDHPTSASKLGDEKSPAHNVIVARMNRRQLNELSAELSREQGQHAELKEFAPSAIDGLSDSTKVKGVIASLGAPASTGLNVDPSALTLGKAAAAAPAPAPTTLAPSSASAADRAGVESYGVAPAASRPVDRAYGRGASPINSAQAAGGSGPATSTAKSERIDGSDVIDPSAKRSADNRAAAGADALHLKIDPMDEPVDVVIVVKSDTPSADTTATDAQKATAKPAPAGATDAANPSNDNK